MLTGSRIALMFVVLATASSCKKDAPAPVPPPEPKPEPAVVPEPEPEPVKTAAQIVEAFLAAPTREAMLATLADDATFTFVGGPPPVHGAEQIGQALDQSLQMGKTIPRRIIQVDDAIVVVQLDYVGNHTLSMMGETPSELPFGVGAVAVATFEDGKLHQMRAYVNQAGTLAQIGLVENVPAPPVVEPLSGEPQRIVGAANAGALEAVTKLTTAIEAGEVEEIQALLAPSVRIGAYAVAAPTEAEGEAFAPSLVGNRRKIKAVALEPSQIYSADEWVLWEGTQTVTYKKRGKVETQPLAILYRVEGGLVSQVHRYENFLALAQPQLDKLAEASAKSDPADSETE